MLVAGLVCGIVAVGLMCLSLYFRLRSRIVALEEDMRWVVEDLDFAFRVLADVDVIVGRRSVLDSERTADVKSWVSSAVATLEHADSLLRERIDG